MRLLVVEDETDLNSIIVKNLEAEGYIVDSCYDGGRCRILYDNHTV